MRWTPNFAMARPTIIEYLRIPTFAISIDYPNCVSIVTIRSGHAHWMTTSLLIWYWRFDRHYFNYFFQFLTGAGVSRTPSVTTSTVDVGFNTSTTLGRIRTRRVSTSNLSSFWINGVYCDVISTDMVMTQIIWFLWVVLVRCCQFVPPLRPCYKICNAREDRPHAASTLDQHTALPQSASHYLSEELRVYPTWSLKNSNLRCLYKSELFLIRLELITKVKQERIIGDPVISAEKILLAEK
jgi:hypothetical protein